MRMLTRTLWVLLGLIVLLPFIQAAMSPLQLSRNPAYIIGGLAGVAALAMLLIQPLFAAGYMPGVHRLRQQRWHRWIGATFGLALLVHIGGLYLTSPDDVSDALLLVSPTPFSVYGVIGLWSAVATILLVLIRRRMRLGVSAWKIVHNILGLVVVVASVVPVSYTHLTLPTKA